MPVVGKLKLKLKAWMGEGARHVACVEFEKCQCPMPLSLIFPDQNKEMGVSRAASVPVALHNKIHSLLSPLFCWTSFHSPYSIHLSI